MALMLLVSSPLAATTIKGVVKANEMGGSGVPNVAISAIEGTNPTVTASDGTFVLDFPRKQPGERVQLLVQMPGMVVVNDFELPLTLPKTPSDAPLTLLICRIADREEMRSRFYRLGSPSPIERKPPKVPREEQEAAEKTAKTKVEVTSVKPSPAYRSHVVMALNNLGATYYRHGELDEALRIFKEALDNGRELAKQDSTYLPEVVETQNNIGNVLSDQNRSDEARKVYDEALAVSRDLALPNPTMYLASVAITLKNIGSLAQKQNEDKAARKAFEEALAKYRTLAQSNPETYLPNVAEILMKLGSLSNRQADSEERIDKALNFNREALKHYRDAALIYESVADKDKYQDELALSRKLLDVAFNKVLERYRKLAEENPATYLPSVADTLMEFGAVKYGQDRLEAAYEAFREAIAIYEDLRSKTKQYGQAIESALKKKLPVSRTLALTNPVRYGPDVAETLKKLGILLRTSDRWLTDARLSEAQSSLGEALSMYEDLEKKSPGTYGREIDNLRREMQLAQAQLDELRRERKSILDRILDALNGNLD
jgi:tetratricopeptide (TPR) repeat protein